MVTECKRGVQSPNALWRTKIYCTGLRVEKTQWPIVLRLNTSLLIVVLIIFSQTYFLLQSRMYEESEQWNKCQSRNTRKSGKTTIGYQKFLDNLEIFKRQWRGFWRWDFKGDQWQQFFPQRMTNHTVKELLLVELKVRRWFHITWRILSMNVAFERSCEQFNWEYNQIWNQRECNKIYESRCDYWKQ